ncbi:MAG: hypothetical protein ACTSR8_17070 [Promethearchaeota archaeon]
MKKNSLLEKPNNKILAIVFITTFILIFVFLQIFASILAQFPANAGLYDMKAAWTKENMDKIVKIWKDDNLDHWVGLMIYVHFIDGFFMIVYGTATFTGLLLVARLMESERLQNFYFRLAFISILAPLLDVVEQINILIMLADPTNINGVNVFLASLSTTLCVWILYPCLVIMLIGFIIALIIKKM